MSIRAHLQAQKERICPDHPGKAASLLQTLLSAHQMHDYYAWHYKSTQEQDANLTPQKNKVMKEVLSL